MRQLSNWNVTRKNGRSRLNKLVKKKHQQCWCIITRWNTRKNFPNSVHSLKKPVEIRIQIEWMLIWRWMWMMHSPGISLGNVPIVDWLSSSILLPTSKKMHFTGVAFISNNYAPRQRDFWECAGMCIPRFSFINFMYRYPLGYERAKRINQTVWIWNWRRLIPLAWLNR